jgi:Mlc titration factor MtfA (ptsG expression regulator)
MEKTMFRRPRRFRVRDGELLSEDEWSSLLGHHPILRGFSPEELGRLRELVTVFIRLKRFEGAEGIVLGEHMKAVIAVQACLPVLNLGLEWYGNWKTIVVVPERFGGKGRSVDPAGVVHEWEDVRIGESWSRGPVVLSWSDVEASGWADGFNVVIHEAAHRLDLLDGAMNGRPALHPGMSPEEWQRVFTVAFVSAGQLTGSGRSVALTDYALTSPAEFFAVVSEVFFERPHALLREHPQVYRLLREFYRQEPDRRLSG